MRRSRSAKRGSERNAHGIGIRYRLRCTVPREKAYTSDLWPGATSYTSITRAPGSLAISASDWNPPAGIGGNIRPGDNGTTYVRPVMLDDKYPIGAEMNISFPSGDHVRC